MTGASSRPPVGVLLGGPSAEHDVSVVSGTAVAAALRDAGLAVTQVLIALDGAWWWLPADHVRAGRPASAYDDPRRLEADGPHSVGVAAVIVVSSSPGSDSVAGTMTSPPTSG